MNIHEKVDSIRKRLKAGKVSAVIIPSEDPHKSEYVAEHWQTRKWLTGFSGSAGTAVVTRDKAILWTDFRYYIQAEKQIKASPFELYRMGDPDVLTVEKYLTQTLNPGDTVGIDGKVVSRSAMKKYRQAFDARNLMIDTTFDPAGELWTDRPPIPVSRAFVLSDEYAGQSRVEKIFKIRENMHELGAAFHLLATLDDIAWLLNLRGQDVHTNPVNIAYVLIGPERVGLFVDKQKIDPEIEAELARDGIDIAAYGDIDKALSCLPATAAVLLDPERVNERLFQSVNTGCKIIEKPNPTLALKAIKNNIQIGHLRETAVKDGVAVVSFLCWLERQDKVSLVTERSAAEVLLSFRKAQEGFVDNSFDPIMAYQDHSAMCHYSATAETDVVIGRSGMFLTDSGGNYLTGTTDITRTICRGIPTPQEMVDYTLVLKGHMAVAMTPFPKQTRGYQIDTLARQYLWKQGMNFGHGTGHGVGFFLCVHEGPASISAHPVDVTLEKGMLMTNEPGLYREGCHGIRLENMVLVVPAFENEFGSFLKFEEMTYCHFETSLMDKTLLTGEEIQWINAYHARVYEKLSPFLDSDVTAWLKKKTMPL